MFRTDHDKALIARTGAWVLARLRWDWYWDMVLTDDDEAFARPGDGDVDLVVVDDEAEVVLEPALWRVLVDLIARQRAHRAQDDEIPLVTCSGRRTTHGETKNPCLKLIFSS